MGSDAALGALGAWMLLASCGPCGSAPRTPPNVVLIVVDTLRADHLDLYDYERATSPHLHDFAERSTVFERAYAHAPWTKASVASLLTSVEPDQHGVHDWDHTLPDDLPMLQDVLRKHGWTTQAVVSHAAFLPTEGNTFHRGFDRFDTSPFEGRGSPHRIHSSRQVTRAGIEALDRLQDAQPFLLWLHYFDPHDAYLAHRAFPFGAGDIDRYDSEIAFTDRSIGRFLAHLDGSGLGANTLVVITADHGEAFSEHGVSGHTLTLYEEALRVPLLIRVPGFEPARIDRSIGQIDLAPTLLDLLGLPLPDTFRGAALGTTDRGFSVPEHRTVYAETRRFAQKRATIRGGWKLIRDLEVGGTELYDLVSDPRELNDRSSEGGPMLHQLEQVLDGRPDPRDSEVREVDEEVAGALKALGYVDDE